MAKAVGDADAAAALDSALAAFADADDWDGYAARLARSPDPDRAELARCYLGAAAPGRRYVPRAGVRVPIFDWAQGGDGDLVCFALPSTSRTAGSAS